MARVCRFVTNRDIPCRMRKIRTNYSVSIIHTFKVHSPTTMVENWGKKNEFSIIVCCGRKKKKSMMRKDIEEE